ncbi:CaiB/BaiF CoA transferase family protein [Kribbella swartbergensis]
MLSGIRVVSFSHFLQGPSACQMLGDLGADIVKIEPLRGAFERHWSAADAFLGEWSLFFLLGNRNVRSVSADLKASSSRSVMLDLVKTADVVVESYRPGVMERLGLGYGDVRDLNPQVIYCSLSGYGSDGPYRDRPGQDVLLQTLSGLAAATGDAGSSPIPAGASIVDQHGAALAAMGILAALLARERTGQGRRVESNLLGAALDLQLEPLTYAANGFASTRSATGISSMYYKPPYGVFATADGHVCLSLTALSKLAALLGDPWLDEIPEGEVFARRDEINARIAVNLSRRTTAEWVDDFDSAGLWHAPVNSYADVLSDPQVIHNETFNDVVLADGTAVRLPTHPLRYNRDKPPIARVPPRLGQHTREVLEQLGLSTEEIAKLISNGAFYAAD